MNNTEAALNSLNDALTDINVKETAVLLNFIANFAEKFTEDQVEVSNLR